MYSGSYTSHIRVFRESVPEPAAYSTGPGSQTRSEALLKRYIPSLCQKPMKSDKLPERHFNCVVSTFANMGARQYLVYVNQLSGWPMVSAYNKAPNKTIEALETRRFAYAKSKDRYDRHARKHPILIEVDEVRIQDRNTKVWDKKGSIIGIREGERCYEVEQNGRVYLRNRRYVRPTRDQDPEDQQNEPDHVD
eukprot:maker-scaffold10325_size2217-snap-gene-0.0 protein:Tk04765 transcript:maker-scaffold10325_size2217-snap-gene-0.0-mRNA-1 annotation:"hypothetical protein DAPPUDRAFT_116586"